VRDAQILVGVIDEATARYGLSSTSEQHRLDLGDPPDQEHVLGVAAAFTRLQPDLGAAADLVAAKWSPCRYPATRTRPRPGPTRARPDRRSTPVHPRRWCARPWPGREWPAPPGAGRGERTVPCSFTMSRGSMASTRSISAAARGRCLACSFSSSESARVRSVRSRRSPGRRRARRASGAISGWSYKMMGEDSTMSRPRPGRPAPASRPLLALGHGRLGPLRRVGHRDELAAAGVMITCAAISAVGSASPGAAGRDRHGPVLHPHLQPHRLPRPWSGTPAPTRSRPGVPGGGPLAGPGGPADPAVPGWPASGSRSWPRNCELSGSPRRAGLRSDVNSISRSTPRPSSAPRRRAGERR